MIVSVCPSKLAKGYSSYCPQAIQHLFCGVSASHDIDFGIDRFRNETAVLNALNRISISGVQEKFPAVVENKKIRLANGGEQSKYILKPAPWDETIYCRKQIPANENLTMQIASQVYGIRTAENGLCFSPKGEIIYVTRRFDVEDDGSKRKIEDFASLLGKTKNVDGENYKYTGSYEDVALAIRRYIPAWMVAMEEFYKIMVFNYIYGNGDAHLKNFSVLNIGEDYVLAPAYDLLNTSIHVVDNDFALCDGLSVSFQKSDIYEETGHPCRKDFETFGLLIGLNHKRINKVVSLYESVPVASRELIRNSFLTEKLKRVYIRGVEQRIQRFNRG